MDKISINSSSSSAFPLSYLNVLKELMFKLPTIRSVLAINSFWKHHFLKAPLHIKCKKKKPGSRSNPKNGDVGSPLMCDLINATAYAVQSDVDGGVVLHLKRRPQSDPGPLTALGHVTPNLLRQRRRMCPFLALAM